MIFYLALFFPFAFLYHSHICGPLYHLNFPLHGILTGQLSWKVKSSRRIAKLAVDFSPNVDSCFCVYLSGLVKILNNYWTKLSKISWFFSGEQSRSIICRSLRHAKANNWSARYFAITDFDNFSFWSLRLFLMKIFGKCQARWLTGVMTEVEWFPSHFSSTLNF